ncbi:MAG: hypothetical protein ABS46_05005 [Cytophagaceae bacterium SCN 52-12]|nr:MAG: hypothetical protein ABS46_05005 [Cytophagaceae bacterium SCN 52-12]
MVALLFSSAHVEAKNNYSNKIALNEDKIKGHAANSFMPSVVLEEVPELPVQKAAGLFDKYTPDQLNRIMGVWPERRGNVVPSRSASLSPAEQAAPGTSYSPEQLVNILGIKF